MKRYIIISLFALTACVNAAEDYYSKENAVVNDETLLSYIESRPEYSVFTRLVKETGKEEYLNGSTLMTLFVPTDDKAPENLSGMSEADKEMLVLNHIALTTIYGRNLGNVSSIMTLCGKTVSVASDGFSHTLNGITLSECDRVCRNGVLHRADDWIVPRKNIMEWIKGLDDDFSIVRDSIINCETRVFDKDSSPVKGVDENGRVVYDSVWVVSNRYLNNIDVAKEGISYTLMAPSNSSIHSFFEERNEWLEAVGHDRLNAADSSALLTWLLRSALIRGNNNLTDKSVRAVSGNEIRTDYFHTADIEHLSNGLAITLDRCYVPKDLHYSRLSFNPYYIRLVFGLSKTTSEDKGTVYDVIWPSINVGNSGLQPDSECVKLQYNTNSETGYYYKFMSTASSDSTAKAALTPLVVMPGKYNLRMRFCTNSDNNTDSFDIYRLPSINGDADQEFLATVTGIKNQMYGTADDLSTDGLVKANLEITDIGEPLYLKVVIPKPASVGTGRRMFVGNCTLVPQDNY
jgi:hypothetical protein bacD2_14765